MNIRESDLPGIGRKFEFKTRNDEKVVIVVHDDGRREMYYFDETDHDESISSVTFNDAEARNIAAILGGIIYKPQALETIEMAFEGLVIEWFKVEENASAVGQTIGNIGIREQYNVTVIAIMKKNLKKLLTPGSSSVIDAGDTLVLSGERKEVKKLIKDLLMDKG